MTASILLLGEYNVGKSHFGGQLLGRLAEAKGALSMPHPPASLAPFDSVLERLHDGRAAPHTPSSQYMESRWPVVDGSDRNIELVWPDYGGEQVRAIGAERRMSPDWRRRIQTSDAWILMIRVNNTNPSDDIFSRPLADMAAPAETPNATGRFTMSDQARIVNFLQWLLFVRGAGTLRRIAAPRLLLLLSCWDELPAGEIGTAPTAVLRCRMPLVASFVVANWLPDALHILGLSALERSLDETDGDEEFVDRGPEAFGYVVLPDGARSSDLTLSITPLL